MTKNFWQTKTDQTRYANQKTWNVLTKVFKPQKTGVKQLENNFDTGNREMQKRARRQYAYQDARNKNKFERWR